MNTTKSGSVITLQEVKCDPSTEKVNKLSTETILKETQTLDLLAKGFKAVLINIIKMFKCLNKIMNK